MRRAVLLLALALTGCATMINQRTERIPVRSEPAGAVVSVDCGSVPLYGGLTPTTIEVPRAEEICSITLGKEGFEETRVDFHREISRVTAGNEVPGILTGTLTGLLAAIIDWSNPVDGDFVADAFRAGHALGTHSGDSIDRKSGAAYKQVPGEVFVRLKPASQGR